MLGKRARSDKIVSAIAGENLPLIRSLPCLAGLDMGVGGAPSLMAELQGPRRSRGEILNQVDLLETRSTCHTILAPLSELNIVLLKCILEVSVVEQII